MPDFVTAGQPTGWYKHPSEATDYFWTGKGFATVDGAWVRRAHAPGSADYEAAELSDAATYVKRFGLYTNDQGLVLPISRIVTTDQLPGFEIDTVLGAVSELTSASGWTASTKGNQALDAALAGLSRTAAGMGANAIVGLRASSFGAAGGITSGFGGDAVGILLMGTAVSVR